MRYCKLKVKEILKSKEGLRNNFNYDNVYLLYSEDNDYTIADDNTNIFKSLKKAEYFKKVINKLIDEINTLEKRNDWLRQENKLLKERNKRQSESLEKKYDKFDNYIDVKAKIKSKIEYYSTKEEELVEDFCGCHRRNVAIKKSCLEELFDELYGGE